MVTATPSLATFAAEHYAARLDSCERNTRQALLAVEQFADWLTRPPMLGDLTESTLAAFLVSLSSRAAPNTIKNKRNYLLHLWRAAWEEGLVPNPPNAKRVPKPRVPAPIPEAYTLDDMRMILDVAERLEGTTEGVASAGYWSSLIRTCYETGGRIGAILKTCPQDFDQITGTLILRGANDKTGKTHFHRLSAKTTHVIAKTEPDRRSRVWPWNKSQCWLCKQLERLILKPAGVAYGRSRGGIFHKFRRTAGTLCEANGGDGSRLLGNTRAVFERHYLDGRVAGNGQSQFLPQL